jgi:hypothetical protein
MKLARFVNAEITTDQIMDLLSEHTTKVSDLREDILAELDHMIGCNNPQFTQHQVGVLRNTAFQRFESIKDKTTQKILAIVSESEANKRLVVFYRISRGDGLCRRL